MTSIQKLPAFKAYDIRGRVPDQLHEAMVYAIGRAYARVIRPAGPVAVGRDIRATSEAFSRALIAGLNAEGCRTVDIGIGGTEMIYFAAGQAGMGGGIMITASHNPADYNGLKMVRAEARPISADSGLKDIEQETARLLAERAASGVINPALHVGRDILDEYVDCLLSQVDIRRIRPLHLVVNGGNGCAGPVFDAFARRLPVRVTRIHHEPDSRFPNGVPNPMLAEQQAVTAEAVRACGADLGLAWDGDFDRCFFFDESGRFIEGYYLVGLLASALLKHAPGAAIVHDPRLEWNTRLTVAEAGGVPVVSKCGHSFIKDKMREVDAVYGGEMSAHHYFRNFFYCDSGMLPWLLVVELLSGGDQPFSAVVEERMAAFPCSGEINFTVRDARAVIDAIDRHYSPGATSRSTLDGLSLEFPNWRFNLRSSNTEPLIRLNVETRGDQALLTEKTDALRRWIQEGA